jgi:hypothetical protein
MLWQTEGIIPNIDARVRGPGPRFKLRYRGVRRIMTKVAVLWRNRSGTRVVDSSNAQCFGSSRVVVKPQMPHNPLLKYCRINVLE